MRGFVTSGLCLGLLVCATFLSYGQEGRLCSLRFEATVHSGPNAEKFSLHGTLTLEASGPFGEVDGVLVTDPPSSRVPAHGQILGRAANLIFDIGDNVEVNGVGTMLPMRGTRGCVVLEGGGVFAGPNDADLGTWLTSLFGSGGGSTTCSVPAILSPSLNSVGRIVMQSGGSCITIPGATVTVAVPLTTTKFGPFNLQSDTSGGLIVGVYDPSVVQPAVTCRIFTVTNPNGQMSGAVTLCR